MKIKINRNIFFSKAFLNELVSAGLKYACISPGSRSTPLTYTLAVHPKIKCFVNIDERSSAFFALGIAKATEKPVMIVTTSGTAVAETYPAVIEAFKSRVPLILCTADRPPELQNCGANQTINQQNIFRNHIRWFRDAGLPSPAKIISVKKIARTAFEISTVKNRGPVHINFPFRKPFEENVKTDEIEFVKLKESRTPLPIQKYKSDILTGNKIKLISDKIRNSGKGIIIVGPNNFKPKVLKKLIRLSQLTSYPLFADGCSQLLFNKDAFGKIISQYDSFLRAPVFKKQHKPGLVLHFGSTPASHVLEEFLYGIKCQRFMINESGDWFDPSKQSTAVWQTEPERFCDLLINSLNSSGFKRKTNDFLRLFYESETKAADILQKELSKNQLLSEPSVLNEVVALINSNSNLFISNSLPVRDLDQFTLPLKKNINVYFNRGASGIDGIISTAAGIASVTKSENYLITGDLAFYHDLNSLYLLKKHRLNLRIILINNSGGGIFNVLPVSQYKNIFDEFFRTKHNLNFELLVSAIGLKFKRVESKKELRKELINERDKASVIEIITDPVKSHKIRNSIRAKIISEFTGK
ncbi:MAG: 2-succinyl-5-enolpyruvyl-6-hydroxy-3-cyclohexene-1-carboxylic-acid synthase [Ignavibacteriaceae bacterium]